MPPRLLIVADPKMLPALTSGLRDGGRFDVQAVPLADRAAALAAAGAAEAVALFYGAPTAPLPAGLQALAPVVRERGARLVAVLQRDQAPHRDECFRAGASDVLFMPLPKEQFVARLASSVALSFAAEGGAAPAQVSVATRSVSSRLERASVSALGVEAPAAVPLKPGETVRLSFGSFQSWGLVVRGTPAAQIRFAGLTPDEEKKIADWVKSGAKPQPAAAPSPAAPSPPSPSRASPPPAARAPVAAAAAAPRATSSYLPPPPPPLRPGARAAPVSGPPPGFAERKAPRGPARATPEGGVQKAGPSAAQEPAVARPAPAPSPTAGARPPANGEGGALAGLFDKADGAPAAAPAAAPEAPPPPKGPPWPVPVPVALCKEVAMRLLADEILGPEVPGNVAASARKVAALLSVSERASIQKTGADSHFAEALAARIALDAATAEGNRLGSARVTPTVDADALAALTKSADEAAGRLQKEANAAIGKGEVESLQLVTTASASLSRDLLNLKETADRLRGLSAAPRMGAGGLDPDVVLPGQQPRPRLATAAQAAPPPRPELRDFRGLDDKPGRGKTVMAVVFVVAAIAVAVHAFYFSVPRHSEIPIAAAGPGVQRIDVTGAAALVTVTPEWLADADANLPKLLQVLKSRQVAKAILTLPMGKAAGVIDVAAGKASGLPPRQAPAPGVQEP